MSLISLLGTTWPVKVCSSSLGSTQSYQSPPIDASMHSFIFALNITMSKFIDNFEKRGVRVNNVEFCKVCGSILDLPESGTIECGICHWKCQMSGRLAFFSVIL